ncbi:hypothetical protein BKA61DRAFT_742496 [Leptodontidium sp. MPI-SDFR-AT-0119]|nr:hypothetical protein BKA61DRAFT_742496 [Leptodontidium sp. MPI-SDFR-AT-0119]
MSPSSICQHVHGPAAALVEEAERRERKEARRKFLQLQERKQRDEISANHYRLLRLKVLRPVSIAPATSRNLLGELSATQHPEFACILPEEPSESRDPPVWPAPQRILSRELPRSQHLRDTDQNMSFDPFLNSIPIELRKVIPSKRRSPHINPSSSANLPTPQDPKIKRQRTTEHARALEAVKLAVGLLEEEFNLREAASEAFPPEITSSHIRTSVSKYENEMSAASERSVCCCCGRLIAAGDISALEDLTAVEECLIAKSHPVGTILKLRPGRRSSSVSYNALRGHIIVIPQDPGPLLQILPSPELRLDTLIKVFWLGKRAPVDADLRPFLQVRKDKVLAALQYLVGHNHLYRDLTINYDLMDGWNADFIPPEIWDNIICLGDSDHHEREGYTVSLQTGNYENDLHAAQDGVFDTDDHGPCITGSVYTDINGER